MKRLKHFFIFSLLIGLLFAFCACATKRLEVPVGFELSEENVLSWDEVEGADKYEIEIFDYQTNKTIPDTTGKEYYDLSELALGNYDIRVRATGDGYVFKDSNWSETLEFEKKYQTGCIYKLIDGRTAYEISRAGKAEGDVYIEAEYRGKPVTRIADGAFKSKKIITKVVVGDNVTKIGKNAFYNCQKLTEIQLPEGLETIGEAAFNSCANLMEVTIPSTVKELGNFTFSYCRKLTTITLKEGLEVMGEDVFSSCSSVTKLSLPDSLTTIADGAFKNMTALTTVELGKNLQAIPSNAFLNATLLENITFYQPENPTAGYVPALKSIGVSAFENCTALTKMDVPEGVESIGATCFKGCTALAAATLPTTLNSLGHSAFNVTKIYTDNIDDGYVYVGNWLVATKVELRAIITIVEGVSTVGGQSGLEIRNPDTALQEIVFVLKENTVGLADAVLGASPILKRVVLPKSVQYVGNETFAYCVKLKEFRTVKNSLKTIGSYAFEGCKNLDNLYLREGLTTIGSYAFKNCEDLYDKEDLIPETVTKIGTRAFEGTDLWNAPEDATGIVYAGTWVVGFKNAGVQNLTLKDGTIGVSDYAFYQTSVRSVTKLKDVMYIGKGAFYECSLLSLVQLNTDLAKIEDYAFYKCEKLTTVHFPSSLKKIGRSAFYKCTSLKTVDLSDTAVEKIGAYAFYGCTSASEVVYSYNLKDIGDYAFYKCSALKNTVIPDTVERIGVRAYYKCENMESLTIGSVETIGDYAFYGCSALKLVKISDGVKTIGNYAFYKCTELQSLSLGKDVETIGDFAFYDATSLSRITLPQSVKKIGQYAFKGCSNVSVLTLNKDYTQPTTGAVSIGTNAFYGCNEMTIYTNAVKTAEGNPPQEWHYRWNSGYRPVVWGCTFASDENGVYVQSVVVSENTLDNVKAESGFSGPLRSGWSFAGWATQSGSDEVVYTAAQIVDVPVGTTLYAVWTLAQ